MFVSVESFKPVISFSNSQHTPSTTIARRVETISLGCCGMVLGCLDVGVVVGVMLRLILGFNGFYLSL